MKENFHIAYRKLIMVCIVGRLRIEKVKLGIAYHNMMIVNKLTNFYFKYT